MSRVPGAFHMEDEEEEFASLSDAIAATRNRSDSEDDDSWHAEDEDEYTMTEDTMDVEEEDEEEDEDGDDQDVGGEASAAAGPQRQLRLAYDRITRGIYVLDEEDNPVPLGDTHLQGTALTMASIRSLFLRQFAQNDDDDDDEEIDSWGPSPRSRSKKYYDVPEGPQAAGVELERSGAFGPPRAVLAPARKFPKSTITDFGSALRAREYESSRLSKSTFGSYCIPNSSGVEVAQFSSRIYSGQYSTDGSFFYSACQDMHVYIYDTRTPPAVGSKAVRDTGPRSRFMRTGHRTSLKTIKVARADPRNTSWTITDANLSPDNQWLCYSSITPRVHLVGTGKGEAWDTEQEQRTLDFAAGLRSNFGIWSLRFSNDGKEIVAGGTGGKIVVYDVDADEPVLCVRGHQDDVNAVAFADNSSPHLLLSGSDDTFVKVWDRRSLSGERASGVFVGHTQGITFVSPKGDGRYCISNGKDQGMKLWDLRMMMSDDKFDALRLDRNYSKWSIPSFDYRHSSYRKPVVQKHPHDVSVMTYRGHAVLRTLIRCHFSPIATTEQKYLYTGSSDGRIHIYSLDGQIVQVIDRQQTHSMIDDKTGDYRDPSNAYLRSTTRSEACPDTRSYPVAVRDVSWHPTEPSMISTSWETSTGSSYEGSLAKHEWIRKRPGEQLEDQVERERLESEELSGSRRRSGGGRFR